MSRLFRLQHFALCLLLAFPAKRASGQSIYTVAGGGTDDGRPATVAALSGPQGIALDASGNLHVADRFNNRVCRIVIRTGILTTIAGNGGYLYSGDGGPAISAGLWHPQSLAFDKAGNLYITDSNNNVVRKVSAGSGTISTVAGSAITDYRGDGAPATQTRLGVVDGLALDAAGNIFIGESGKVRKISVATGIMATVAGKGTLGDSGDGGPALSAELRSTTGLAIDGRGNLFIADELNHRIRKVDAQSGIISTVAGNGTRGFSGDGGPATGCTLAYPSGVTLDTSGNLYIADTLNQRVRKIAAATTVITTIAGGSSGFSGDGGLATAAGIFYPDGIALDANDNLFIAEQGRVRRVDATNGIISTVAGSGNDRLVGDGDPATAAVIDPAGVVVDAAGDLYIADTEGNRVRKVSSTTGRITTVAGNGVSGDNGDGQLAPAAQLTDPLGLAMDRSGNLYIADELNERIRKVNAQTGIISTVAGNGTAGALGDNGPATAAQLNGPSDVDVDSSGNLYIADTGNHRIRRVDPTSGAISTLAGNGSGGFAGDGGPATAAALFNPTGVASDSNGNVYIADFSNRRIRKVSTGGLITTVAGTGGTYSGDGGLAVVSGIDSPLGVHVDSANDLYIAEGGRIRKVSVSTGIITTLAGGMPEGYSGDGGAATAARLAAPFTATLDPSGNLYVADTGNSRVRVVRKCVAITQPVLAQPANNSSGVPVAPVLSWGTVKGVVHYDVYLDTSNPPQSIVARDLVPTSYSPSNLEPLTTYFWKVTAKGDGFCENVSSASTDVFSFKTNGSCGPPSSSSISQ